MDTAYENLEGKEILFIVCGMPILAIVTGCDSDLGISIQRKTSKEYLMCLNGPMSPISKDPRSGFNAEKYSSEFEGVVKMIRSGVVKATALMLLFGTGKRVDEPTAGHCPFSQ